MKHYIGTKEIKATPMNRLEYNKYRGWELPADEDGSGEGFLVEYIGSKGNHPEHEGYISWSPTNAFNKAYKETTGIPFGLAVEAMKKGHKIARSGWNGKRMYVTLMSGHPDGVPANTETARKHGIQEGDIIKIRPYMTLMTAQEDVASWAPSGSDALAEDWYIV